MIISHKYKYLFVELPRTGTTAISDQLINFYGGEKILIKHASYRNFRKYFDVNHEFKDYYVFSCVRNPLDRTVSMYEKLKNREGHLDYLKNPFGYRFYKRKLNFIQKGNSFEDYFLKFYKLPYDDWGSIDYKNFQFIIRFESLQEDFSKVLEELGIEQVQKIPMINKTKKKRHFSEYYTKRIQKRATNVFAPYCEKFGYKMPWEGQEPSRMSYYIYDLMHSFRKVLWIYSKDLLIRKRKKV